VVRFGLPALAWAGAALALVPLVLHLLTRRPGDPRPLPTARFLTPRTRMRLRFRRWPEEGGLLFLRVLLLLLVAGAFAGPRWVPGRSGTLEVVLLDAGEGMASVWGEAVARAAARIAGGDAPSVLVLFDSVARPVPGGAATSDGLEALEDAGPAVGVEADYRAALAALGELPARFPGMDSARVALVTRPRWEAWSPGLAAMRGAWPGGIELIAVEGVEESGADGPGATAESVPGPGTAVLLSEEGGGFFAGAALEALGWTVTRTGSGGADPAPELYVVLGQGAAGWSRADAWAREGATVVLAGAAGTGAAPDGFPWSVSRGGGDEAVAPGGGGTLVLDGGGVVRGAVRGGPGEPAQGARLLAAWEDGAPAAAALPHGDGCLVYVNSTLEEGRLPLDPGFPSLLERLAEGCDALPAALPPGALDRGAREWLEGSGGASPVALGPLAGGSEGRPLARWFLAAAFLVALAESRMAGRMERRRATDG
jgi:hypothetical protein